MVGTKIPESVLVIIHTSDLQVLLLERADHPGFWQSVTGSRDTWEEPLIDTARRELWEETGIRGDASGVAPICDWAFSQTYEIYPHWRHRYPAGVTHNVKHVFSVCVPMDIPIRLSAREHLRHEWCDWSTAAERCFSWSNAKALQTLPRRIASVLNDRPALDQP